MISVSPDREGISGAGAKKRFRDNMKRARNGAYGLLGVSEMLIGGIWLR